MSLFSVIATVCTLSACNNYTIDTAASMEDAVRNTENADKQFSLVWEDEHKLTDWLKKQHINESIFEIVSVDFSPVEADVIYIEMDGVVK